MDEQDISSVVPHEIITQRVMSRNLSKYIKTVEFKILEFAFSQLEPFDANTLVTELKIDFATAYKELKKLESEGILRGEGLRPTVYWVNK